MAGESGIMHVAKRLEGKVAILTGAASGIGAETARAFAAHGASVVIADMQDDMGIAVVEHITDAGGTAIHRRLDVSDEGQWKQLVEETVQRYGRLDVLGNIAGIGGRDPQFAPATAIAPTPTIEEMSVEHWNRVMSVNVTGVFLGTKAAIPAMRASGGGSIINVSSVCGFIGIGANAAYHTSKGAVRIFTKSTASQHGAENIRANSVHPGVIVTPMTEKMFSQPEVAAFRMNRTILKRFGKPYDVAMACLYLASDESSWVTGSELTIDGGEMAL